ncbi:MAG: hypothetical protein F4X97_11125 [Boseongicola sp. SB0662_bin_57]|nr:hypothetical protein [Boseongicola sp. SB0662_bin_57]
MNSNLKLLPAALLVAVLALAGCGGGGSDDTTTTPPEPTEPPPPASVEQLSLDIQSAENAAMTANGMADAALKNAMKYDDMLTTTEVAGDSGAAMMAAQAILKAEMDVGTALENAETALQDAKDAKTAVMMLPDTHPHKATLMASVDRAIKNAEKYVTAIKGISTGVDLEAAVASVKGADKKGTPRSKANEVGMDIADALALANAARHPFGPDAPAGTVPAALKVVMDDSRGMTWEEIVKGGGGSVMSMPIGTNNAGVKVASVAGMATAKVWATDTDRPDGTIADGSSHPTANYMGIPGTVHCLGTCKVTDDNKLDGSWYFAPTTTGTHWVRNTDNATRVANPYVADSIYATYGHWLTVDVDGNWSVRRFANISDSTAAGATGTNVATADAALGLASGLDGIDDGNKATYSGGAVGMSVRTQGSGESKTTDSGRFTADVTLNASFGATPTVTGKVNNFAGGAVNSGWVVNLGEATLQRGSDATGVTVTGGRDGTWTAQAYGTDATKRPTGIFGGFSAHFSDGDAAGAYATTKD